MIKICLLFMAWNFLCYDNDIEKDQIIIELNKPFKHYYVENYFANNNIRCLSVIGDSFYLSDSDLVHFSQLDHLIYIDLSCNKLKGFGLSALPKNIKALSLDANPLVGVFLHELCYFDYLESLSLGATNINQQDIKYLLNSSLKYLNIAKNYLSDSDLLSLPMLPNLEVLDLHINEIKGSFLQYLKKYTNLRYLSLRGNLITDDYLNNIVSLKQIKKLDLSNNFITGSGLTYLKYLTNLFDLDLSENPLDLVYLKDLFSLKKLEFLGLADLCITNDFLEDFWQLERLEDVYLAGNPITEEGLYFLPNLCNLTHLDLSRTNVTENILPILSKVPNLLVLNISNTKLETLTLLEFQQFLPHTQIIGLKGENSE